MRNREYVDAVMDTKMTQKPVIDTMMTQQPVVDTMMTQQPVVDIIMTQQPVVDGLARDAHFGTCVSEYLSRVQCPKETWQTIDFFP